VIGKTRVARTFRDLNVYRAAREAAEQIRKFTRHLPIDERYALSDQIRRSSRAVKAMIAEAWARRRYKAVFVNKLDEALGEATETQSWLDDTLDAEYLSREQLDALDSQDNSIGRMLSRMIDRADDFVNTNRPPIIALCRHELKKLIRKRSQMTWKSFTTDSHLSRLTSHLSPIAWTPPRS
jgi:four helix bundle protein